MKSLFVALGPAVLALLPGAQGNALAQRDTVVRVASRAVHQGGGTAREVASIGNDGGDAAYAFTRVTAIIPDADGTVWVLDYEATFHATVRQYDARGRYVRTLGGTGAGPGEYRGVIGLAQLPDGRIALRDEGNHRINIYKRTGAIDTTWMLGSQYPFPYGGVHGLFGDASGRLWVSFSVPRVRATTAGPIPPAQRKFARFDGATGKLIDTVDAPELAVPPRITMRANVAGGSTSLSVPNGPSSSWAIHPAGYFATVVNARYAIDLRIPPRRRGGGAPTSAPVWREGDTVVSVRQSVPSRVLTPGQARQIRDSLLAKARQMPGFESTGSVPEIPRVLPPLGKGRIYIGSDGRLWVSLLPVDPMANTGSVDFDVYEVSGQYVGRVAGLPTAFLESIRGDDVWVVRRDDNDVERAVKYHVGWSR